MGFDISMHRRVWARQEYRRVHLVQGFVAFCENSEEEIAVRMGVFFPVYTFFPV